MSCSLMITRVLAIANVFHQPDTLIYGQISKPGPHRCRTLYIGFGDKVRDTGRCRDLVRSSP